jgi:hypothetical protein
MSARTPAEIRQEHADLIHRYCHVLDTPDWDLFASLFADDTEFLARIVEAGKPGPDSAHVVGRDAIVAKIRRRRTSSSSSEPPRYLMAAEA